ncbi:MAG: hypothetical protein M0P59_05840 [Gallionella sp.]|jgi:hypothetical protein|nr:hypothetical protein [Gallionella sp.]MCK9353664.1 hypothetical protein [Gallionella sp.]
MGLFDWLKGKQSAQANLPLPYAKEQNSVASDGHTEKEIFQSPSLLAEWVDNFILRPFPLEKDYELLPDDETRKNLNISIEQRERCVREYSVLRVAGVSSFIKQNYPDSFWLAFSSQVAPYLCRHIYGARGDEHFSEVAQAVESYVDGFVSEDRVDLCAQNYLARVYDDSDNFFKLKFGGVGFIGFDFIAHTYEAFRDAYCQVTQGMSYESVKLIAEALEKIEAEKAQQ